MGHSEGTMLHLCRCDVTLVCRVFKCYLAVVLGSTPATDPSAPRSIEGRHISVVVVVAVC